MYVDIVGLDEFISKCALKLKNSNNQKYNDLLRRHSGGNLAAVVPKSEETEPIPVKKISCESCRTVLSSAEFVWYDLKTNTGLCRECYGHT